MRMKREDIMKMTTEELCAIDGPDQVEAYSTAEGRHLDDPEFDAYIKERIGHLSEPYIKEILAGFADKRDISEMVTRFDREPALVKMHVWGQLTQRGYDQIELTKYTHRLLARSILQIFAVKLPENQLGKQREAFDQYKKGV